MKISHAITASTHILPTDRALAKRPALVRGQTSRFFRPTPSGAIPSPATGGFQAHILVVDDDADVRYVLERVLCAAGYRVSCAGDGLAGWNALCVGSFDLLITDHDMPRLTGLALLRLVRTVPFNLPVILISGRMPSEAGDLEDLLRPGLALAKPFSFVELLENIRELLSQSTVAAAIPGWEEQPASAGAQAARPITPWQEEVGMGSTTEDFEHASKPTQELESSVV